MKKIKKRERGSVAMITAFSMVMLLGVSALAIDIGNLLVARAELQNAADAAALAGAGCLYTRTGCINTTTANPDWNDAVTTASNFATATAPAPSVTNYSQSTQVQVASTSSGYWNITGSPAGLQTGITPSSNDMPAVQVAIVKDGSNANGSVPVFLSTIFGTKMLKTAATATAVVSIPGYVGSNLFPLAIPKCMYDNFWNSKTNSPYTYPNYNPSGSPLDGSQTEKQISGQPFVFDVTSAYHATSSCEAGQWTSFNKAADGSVGNCSSSLNSDNCTDALINNLGSAGGMSIGDQTYIQPGTQNNLYSDTQACSYTGNKKCEWVTMPVVSTVSAGKGNQSVLAFACVHIINAAGGSSKTVTIQMAAPGMSIQFTDPNTKKTITETANCVAPNSGGAGVNYGSVTPARLVQ